MSHRGLMMFDLCFGEQDLPRMAFLRRVVLLLFAGVLLFHALLRFEPNFRFALFVERAVLLKAACL